MNFYHIKKGNELKMKKLLQEFIFILICFFITSCASMFSTETQSIKITSNDNSQFNSNIMCHVQNGRGSWTLPLGESTAIRRDSRPLTVNCYNQDHTLVGTRSVPSIYNTTNLWNIPLTLIPVAGIVGWIVDGTNGTTNEYPTTVKVSMNNSTNLK